MSGIRFHQRDKRLPREGRGSTRRLRDIVAVRFVDNEVGLSLRLEHRELALHQRVAITRERQAVLRLEPVDVATTAACHGPRLRVVAVGRSAL